MTRRELAISLAALFATGCTDKTRSDEDQKKATAPGAVLNKPIGIDTVADDFTPLVQAGQPLPYTHSETFTNKTDGGPEALVQLSQHDESGTETIARLIIKIPPVADNALQITVTLKISEDKQMSVKTTVSENGSVQKFGPFPVE